MSDPVNHPPHYTSVVPGIECIDVTEHFPFLRGNAIKYLWRAGAKGDPIEELRKARWYIDLREYGETTAETWQDWEQRAERALRGLPTEPSDGAA